MDLRHEAEVRRCLIAADVDGLLRVWRAAAPHFPKLSAGEALLALHMARYEARSVPQRLRIYSRDLLREAGLERVEGKWVPKSGPVQGGIATATGVSSVSRNPGLRRRIVRVMHDALMNALAKGTTEGPMLRETMLAARARLRFRERLV